MNWTEGNLARHSRGRRGKEVILRQKEHFAKARSGLLNGTKKSPPFISFLTHVSSPLHKHSSRSRHSHVVTATLSPSSRKRPRQKDAPTSSQFLQDVDLTLPQPPRSQRLKEEDEGLQDKRRKLLSKGDWVGTTIQKPIQMEFSQPRRSPSNPWGPSQTRRRYSQHRSRHFDRIKLHKDLLQEALPVRRGDMRVRVGSQEKALFDSSNASVRSRGHRRHRTTSLGEYSGNSWFVCLNSMLIRCSTDESQEIQHHGRKRRPRQDGADHSSSSDQPHVLTSSPLVFQPVPRRLAMPPILSSGSVDSQNADSMVVQIRPHRPPVPPSQVEENHAWKEWVDGSETSHNSTGQVTVDHRGHIVGQISPGISHQGLVDLMASPRCEDTTTYAASSVDRMGSDEILPQQYPSEQPEEGEEYEPIIPQSAVDSDSLGTWSRQDDAVDAHKSSEVSLLVINSTPSSGSLSEHPSNNIQESSPTRSSTQVDNSPENYKELSRTDKPEFIPAKRIPPRTAVQVKVAPAVTEDENELWRKFVHLDSDDDFEDALEEARKDTVRALKPSETSASTDNEVEMEAASPSHQHGQEAMLWGSGFDTESNDFTESADQSGARDLAMKPWASNAATTGTSPLSFLTSEPLTVSPATLARTDQDTSTPSDSSRPNQRETHASSESMSHDTDTNSLAVQPAKSQVSGDTEENFRFAPPRLFVGKKSAADDPSHPKPRKSMASSTIPQIMDSARGPAKRSRRGGRPRARDGRTDIRDLPDYRGSDDIEEFEEDLRSTRAQKSSLFGALNTSDDF